MNAVDAARRPEALEVTAPVRPAVVRRFAEALRTGGADAAADDTDTPSARRGRRNDEGAMAPFDAVTAEPHRDRDRDPTATPPETSCPDARGRRWIDALVADITDGLRAARRLAGDSWRIRLRLSVDVAPLTELDLACTAGRFTATWRTACRATCRTLVDALPVLDAALRERQLQGTVTAVHLVDPDELS